VELVKAKVKHERLNNLIKLKSVTIQLFYFL